MGWLEEKIVEKFLDWEMLGRGWLPSTDFPVTPEPPFRLFSGYTFGAEPDSDDGRQASVLESWLDTREDEAEVEEEADEIDFRFAEGYPTVEIRVHLQERFRPDDGSLSCFLLSISDCRGPLAFEIFGTHDSIQLQLVAEERDADLVMRQATSWFPEAYFTTKTGGLLEALADERSERVGITDCGLAKVFHFPVDRGGQDPLRGIVGALADFDPGELGLMQILFEPVRHPWARSLLDTVLADDGNPFFADGDALAKATMAKVSKPLYGVTVRFAVAADSSDRLNGLMRNLLAPLAVASATGGNEFEPYYDEEEDHLGIAMLAERSSRRFGMLLNLQELMHLVRFPATEHLPGLVDSEIRSRPAPSLLAKSASLELGTVLHRGEEQVVRLGLEERVRHTHIIGASGTGKSNLLLNCIRQDMENGQGIAVLDPHGDLIDSVLGAVPEARVEDVILFDPSDERFPIGFNILDAHSELEKTLLASDLCSVFQRFSTSWGDQMTAVLSNAILAFLESSEGGTLSDLRRFLVEKPYRESFLETVGDPEVVYFWQNDFKLLSGRPEGSIVTRLNSFLRPKPIRNMVSQRTNKVNFANIMDEGKILLARIPQGLIGEENAHLLGSMLVTKIHQLVIGRQAAEASSRRPFFLYIDEFPHFMTGSMASILSGSRKYNLGLTLVHQEMRQLESRDRDVASAVLSNTNNRIVFRVGNQDAKSLEEGFSHYTREDILNLGTGQAIGRIGGADQDFCVRVPWSSEQEEDAFADRVNRIRDHSRAKYGVSVETLESEIRPVQKEPQKKSKEVSPATAADSVPPKDLVSTPTPQLVEKLALPKQAVQKIPGRGGKEHKALQKLMKQIGNAFDYRASIEKLLPNGQCVDVLLEKGEDTIAVEVCVTTTLEHEQKNIAKCLEMTDAKVLWICPDDKKRKAMSGCVKENFLKNEQARIGVMHPDDIQGFLRRHSKSKTEKSVSRGYAVNVSYVCENDEERRRQRTEVGKTLANASKRLIENPTDG